MRSAAFNDTLKSMGLGFNLLQDEGRLFSEGEHEFEQERHLVFAAHDMRRGAYATTAILEKDRIAYIDIRDFIGAQTFAGRLGGQFVLDFYHEIQGYEHLIIDLRRNSSGFADFFHEFILGPNITEVAYTDGFYLSVHSGRYAHDLTLPFLTSIHTGFFSFQDIVVDRRRGLRPITEILEEYDLPQLNPQHTTRIQYGFPVQYSMDPIPLNRTQPEFDGKVWILTGPTTGSGGHIASWLAKDSGFATLVGQNTGGSFGGHFLRSKTFPALPNSKILITFDVYYITDRYGYGLEAGVTPHYRSRPGMGALETTLALIAEGWSYGG
jgi:hypothetical protein